MVYTSNAHGQSEETHFIDADDSTTRVTTRFYNWRGKLRQILHPDSVTNDYEYDDHNRMTAEKLNGDTEKYEFEYCLCGSLKFHKYTYQDSKGNSDTRQWTYTTDDVGRVLKEYHPYTIHYDGAREYCSTLFEYDTASRRTRYSDPTFGHTTNDPSWTSGPEPADESDWSMEEPLRYRYSERGGLDALGRVAGGEITAGEGEPYFVDRDASGRVGRVIYPDRADSTKGDYPEYEIRYKYTDDGRVSEVATVSSRSAADSEYGPEEYVVQYAYDDAGRLIRKVVIDNTADSSASTRYEAGYEFDGRGNMTREWILKYTGGTEERMTVLKDVRTTYDLGRNPTEIKVYSNSGPGGAVAAWAYTESRTYASGYQITGFSTNAAADVTINTSGSYTYDTNNNLTGTKKLDASRSGTQLEYRAEWTFEYDRKNRMKSNTNTNASNVRGNVWYDAYGRIWQRWNDNSSTEDWDATLRRYVYDGSLVVQEHDWYAAGEEEWIYTYSDIKYDWLRHAAGTRQRERSGGNDTDYYLQSNNGTNELKTERDPVAATYAREFRTASLDQLPSSSFADLSPLVTSNGYVEMYGGTTAGGTAGFDPLIPTGTRHALPATRTWLTPLGNNRMVYGGQLNKTILGNASPANMNPVFKDINILNENDIGSAVEGYNALVEQCGETCVEWASSCITSSYNSSLNVFYNFCCLPVLCPLIAFGDDVVEAGILWLMCMDCICGSNFDLIHGRNCMCDNLQHFGATGLNIEYQFFQYFKIREYCNSGNDCITLPQTQIDAEFNKNECNIDCFTFPWPSCYDMCILGGFTACELAEFACRQFCLRCPGNITCIKCCESARDYCETWAASHRECDPGVGDAIS